MSPITRETIVERRQPLFRWSPVFAGAAVAFGLWVLLQMLGLGVGLLALGPEDLERRDMSIAMIVWTFAAPLIALFFGGLIAGRLAMTRDSRFASLHGLIVWALTAVLGIATTVLAIGAYGAIHFGKLAMHASQAAAAATGPAAEVAAPGATSTAAYALLFTGIGMVLGLVAAALGGAAGARHERKHAAVIERVETAP